jgi:hypothetical protein
MHIQEEEEEKEEEEEEESYGLHFSLHHLPKAPVVCLVVFIK